MTTVLLSPSPILQFFNNSGQPNAGGSLLTQVGGVNYPTYQDSAGTIPLPNPIPLNARGEVSNSSGTSVQLFLTAGVTYTFTLYDANNNQLNQSTYVVPAITTNSPTEIIYNEGGTGAVNRTLQSKLQEFVSVVDFGAVGDGVTDNTTSIISAISVATSLGKNLYFPSGTYFCSGVIGSVGCSIFGDSSASTKIIYNGLTANFINFSGKTIQNIFFQASNSSYVSNFIITSSSYQSFNNCQFIGPSNATSGSLLYMNGAINIEINGCYFSGHNFSIIGQDSGGAGFCNGVSISNTLFSGYNTAAIANGGQGWNLKQVLFEPNTNNLIKAIYTSSSCKWYGTSISGCWFGDQTAQGPNYMIQWQGNGLSVSGCYCNATGYLDTYFVNLIGTSSGISITGNYFGSFLGILNAGSYATNVSVIGNILNPFQGTITEVNGNVTGSLLSSNIWQLRPIPLPTSGTEPGQIVYDSNTNKIYCWNGSTWNPLF